MLRAIIFDFDGVIVDSEPLILRLTQQMAAQEGWTITEEEYFHDYLALDDRGIIEHLYSSHGRQVDTARRDELMAWKIGTYAEAIQHGLPAFPGAAEFVRWAAADYAIAIASGSLRAEIEHLLEALGLRALFAVLSTADETARSKPDPGVYLNALAGLRKLPRTSASNGKPLLDAPECLAIEDAPAGIEAAHAAGMRCLALAHTRPAEELGAADWVRDGFTSVNFEQILAEYGNRPAQL